MVRAPASARAPIPRAHRQKPRALAPAQAFRRSKCIFQACPGQPSARAHCVAGTNEASTAPSAAEPIVQYKSRPRKVLPGPQVVPIQHSSCFLLHERQRPAEADAESADAAPPPVAASAPAAPVPDSGAHAVDWALHQADEYLNRFEESARADGQASTARKVVQSAPVQITLRAMQGVSTLGVAAAPKIMQLAVPASKKILAASAEVMVTGAKAVLDASKDNQGKDKKKGRW